MRVKKRIITLTVAGVFGLTAGVLAVRHLQHQPLRPVAAEPAASKLAVASRDLPVGSVLKSEDIRLIDWPQNALPSGYTGNAADLVGHGLIAPVSTNEPVLMTKLANKEAGGGLPIIIPEGMRGVSVKVDEVIGVAGFVLPGTRVDVLVTIEPPQDGSDKDPISRVILQNVRTLASGQTIQRDAEGKPQTVTVITLLVTPEQAESLTLASNEGRIQLALRNMLDNERVETTGIRASRLTQMGTRSPSPAARAPRPVAPPSQPVRSTPGVVIETYRGGEKTLSTFTPDRQ